MLIFVIDIANVTIWFKLITTVDNSKVVIIYWLYLLAYFIDNTYGGSTFAIVI